MNLSCVSDSLYLWMIPASDPWLLTINKSNICDLKEKEKEKKKKDANPIFDRTTFAYKLDCGQWLQLSLKKQN